MAPTVLVLLWTLVGPTPRTTWIVITEFRWSGFLQWIIVWQIAKLLEIALGPHRGIIYRCTGTGTTKDSSDVWAY